MYLSIETPTNTLCMCGSRLFKLLDLVPAPTSLSLSLSLAPSLSSFLVLHNVLASTNKSVHVLEDAVYREVWQRVRWWNIADALTDSDVEQSAHCAAFSDRAQGNRPHVACRHKSQLSGDVRCSQELHDASHFLIQ